MEIGHSSEKRRLHIVLSLDNPRQRETWEILSQEKNKTSAVCEAVCGFHAQKSLEDTLRKVLRKELNHMPLAQQSVKTAEEADISCDSTILDFLLALQNE